MPGLCVKTRLGQRIYIGDEVVVRLVPGENVNLMRLDVEAPSHMTLIREAAIASKDVLTQGERIFIGDHIEVILLTGGTGRNLRVNISAPRNMKIVRESEITGPRPRASVTAYPSS